MLSSFELIETMLNLYLNPLMAVVGILYIRIKKLLLKAKLYDSKYWFFYCYGWKFWSDSQELPWGILWGYFWYETGDIYTHLMTLHAMAGLLMLIIERHHCHWICDGDNDNKSDIF